MKKTTINAESFAQAVVSSHPEHGLNQQLKEYVAALELAKSYNAEITKAEDDKRTEDIIQQDKYLRDMGF